MKHTLILFISFFISLAVYPISRGDVFEKEGLIYTVGSTYIIGDTIGGGEVYVSGVSVSDIDLVVPVSVVQVETYGKKGAVKFKFSVSGIGDNAFEGARLEQLHLPHNMKFIGKEAFKDMELKSNILILPQVKRILSNAFYGMKAKLYLQSMDCGFEDTFQDKSYLPKVYVGHDAYKTTVQSIDKTLLYTIGGDILKMWTPKSEAYEKIKYHFVSYLDEKTMFKTLGTSTVSPTFNVRKAKRYEKSGTNLDMLPPYEYSCYNTYNGQSAVYSEFVKNSMMYRVKKDEEYFYFTLDGKPITDKATIADASGKDPFGLQILSQEELKASKARKVDVNSKASSIMNSFGF